MPKRIEVEEILGRNPQIDPDRLDEAREMLEHLRESGVQRKEYDLVPPFGGRRVSPRDDERTEPRFLRLREALGVE